MRHELRTEIDIEAPPEVVWSHLAALARYPEWNPFITSASGEPVVGNRLTLHMEPPGGRAMTFRPTVTEVAEAQAFEWLGHLGISGLFDGRHRFELTPTGSGGTHLVQRESFRGILVRLLRRMIDGPTKAGFEAMNQALAERAATSA